MFRLILDFLGSMTIILTSAMMFVREEGGSKIIPGIFVLLGFLVMRKSLLCYLRERQRIGGCDVGSNGNG